MRAHIRGDVQKIYVYDNNLPERGESDEYCLDPIVWIFNTERNNNSKWNLYSGDIFNVKKYIQDSGKLERAAREQGINYICGANFGEKKTASRKLMRQGIQYIFSLQGIVYFVPPHFTIEQEGSFLRNYNYERVPFCNWGIKSLKKVFKKQKGIELDMADWPVSMVRMAIAYAQRKVSVVVPNDLMLPHTLFEEARRKGIYLNVALLSYFPKENIEKIAQNFGVYTIKGTDEKEIPESVERYLGERKEKNRDIVPKWLLNYGTREKTVVT